MSEEHLSADPAVDPAVDPTLDPAVDPTATPPAAPEGVATPPAVEPKPDSGIQKRFSELSRQRREAEARAAATQEALDRAIATLERLATPAVPDAPTIPEAIPERPIRSAYESPEDYDAALVEWASASAARRFEEKFRADQAKQREQLAAEKHREEMEARFQRIQSEWNERKQKAMETHPDLEEAIDQAQAISEPMAHSILQAENGPELAYHLSRNPDEARRIYAMTLPGQFYPKGHFLAGQPLPDVQRQVFEMGRLAAKLAAPAATVSTAPAPIVPLRTAVAGGPKPLGEMSMDEYFSERSRRQTAH